MLNNAVFLTVSTHSRLKAAVLVGLCKKRGASVSTHSRLKAAGRKLFCPNLNYRFNTQPPEGGWKYAPSMKTTQTFQHTAA